MIIPRNWANRCWYLSPTISQCQYVSSTSDEGRIIDSPYIIQVVQWFTVWFSINLNDYSNHLFKSCPWYPISYRISLHPCLYHSHIHRLPSRKVTYFLKITMFNGKSHYKSKCSIAMLNCHRVISTTILERQCCEQIINHPSYNRDSSHMFQAGQLQNSPV